MNEKLALSGFMPFLRSLCAVRFYFIEMLRLVNRKWFAALFFLMSEKRSTFGHSRTEKVKHVDESKWISWRAAGLQNQCLGARIRNFVKKKCRKEGKHFRYFGTCAVLLQRFPLVRKPSNVKTVKKASKLFSNISLISINICSSQSIVLR